MFPTVMLILNVSSVAVLWFGGHRVDAGQMQIGALTAFLAYLVQILMSVMMATFMLMMVPRAVGVRRPDRGGPRHRDLGGPAGRAGHRARTAAASWSSAACEFTYPGAEEPVLRGPVLHRPARADHRDHRLHRRRQDHPGQPGAAAVRRHRRRGATSTGSTYATWTRSCCGAGSGWCRRRRSCSPAPSPATCATASRTPPRTRCGRRWRSPRRRDFVEAMPERLDAPITQGGTNVSGGQRQRLAIARALIRQPEIYLFDDSFSALDLATDARLRAALRPGHHRRDGRDRRAAGVHDPRRRPDPGARGRRRRRPRHARGAAGELSRPTRRSSRSQLTAEEAA